MNIKNTVNKEEIDKFSKLADEWWDQVANLLHCINLTL